MAKLNVVVLAAGKGTRMFSSVPKVLHTIAGKPMLQHVLTSVQQLTPEQIQVVYGFGGETLLNYFADYPVNWVLQDQQLGTGHAVKQAMPNVADEEDVLILYGDTPLISPHTLQRLLATKQPDNLSLLTVQLADPTGYGRIVRQEGRVVAIVEQKDASPEQAAICEVNTGILVVSGGALKRWLDRLNNNNAQKEFYLTDIIAFAAQEGVEIATTHPSQPFEVQGVNNRVQQAELERAYQTQNVKALLLAGVSFADPARFDLRGELQHGQDVFIDTNVIVEGQVTLGHRVVIGTGCVLKNCSIAEGSVISPYTVIEGSQLAADCTVGPFARLRPGAQLGEKAHVGNFVELKNAHLGAGTKAGHLSYLGDADIGSDVNIGAGTITCNYDGANKFKTIIGDDVFIGSDTQLVAPVSIAQGATIGAGTTVTKDVQQDELVISRAPQRNIQGWVRPAKKK